MLLKTRVELELVTDHEIFLMLDSGMRGGICTISKRHAKANNPALGPLFDPSLPTTWISYLDANNLYGWAMSQMLPFGGFEWVPKSELAKLKDDIDILSPGGNTGYVMEVDLEYPAELHEVHNDYPLAPERLCIRREYLGPTQLAILQSYNQAQAMESEKLVPNLMRKSKYVVHFRNLQLYIKHGLVLTKVHRALRFRQSAWLASYIMLNQELRVKSKTDFEKDFFKLMNNSSYGKTCENLKKRSDIRLSNNEQKVRELVEKPHCLGFRIFGEKLAAVELRKVPMLINRPFYIGFAVLELSKTLMFRFHYERIVPRYGGRAQLLLTDTDSLVYEIKTRDLQSDMSERPDLYDLTGSKALGLMKDEFPSTPILELVALRPKMYSVLTATPESSGVHYSGKLRAKGISRAAARKLRHEMYLQQLREPSENIAVTRRIGSSLHDIHLYECRKRALCAYDDKVFPFYIIYFRIHFLHEPHVREAFLYLYFSMHAAVHTRRRHPDTRLRPPTDPAICRACHPN